MNEELTEAEVRDAIDKFNDYILDGIDSQFRRDSTEPPFYRIERDYANDRMVAWVTEASWLRFNDKGNDDE